MGLLGYLTGGASGFGPSRQYDSLPYKGWRELSGWIEEYVDAIGYRLDVINSRFVSSAGRARLLDTTTATPTDSATNYFANATTPASLATSSDTMLDVILFIALGLYPADSNLTIAQKQALTQVGWDALKRKGTRLRLLNLASKIADGVSYGWTLPPNNFSVILGDGAPDPGFGTWVQANGSTTAVIRPWLLNAERSTVSSGTPAFSQLGVGYSQFRAGYSATGETLFPTGCRINILNNEHFSSWSTGLPVGWTQVGTGTITQSTSASSINWEYTGNAAVLDQTAAGRGTVSGLLQTAGNINNQLTHRFQLDYAYTNSQNVSTLTVQITDVNRDGVTYYWNNSTNRWQTTSYKIVVPPSSSRARFAFDIVPQASLITGTTEGTTALTCQVSTISDGTATTQTTYTLYRVGLYEKFSLTAEQAATGERTLWLPMIDAPGWSTASRTAGGAALLESANAARTAYKLVNSSTGASFPYHAALSDNGYRAHGTWTNLLKGSNDFGADWTLTNATRTANATISPIVGESSATACNLTATSTGAKVAQGSLGTPTSKTYVGGVWVKKLSTDGNFTDVTISLVSTSTKSAAFTLIQSQGWQLLPFNVTFGGGDVAALSLQIAWGAASSNGQIAVADAYLYDVTSNPAVLYPPVIRSAIGSTATLGATKCQALTSNQNVSVLHPLLQRTLVSVVRGTLGLEIVPTFDAASQPNGVIFDTAQGAAQNRIALRVNSGALELRRWDNSGNQWVASLALTKSASPTSSQVTWLRDTSITIRCAWDANTTMLSAGNSSNSGTKPGSWAPSDTSVAAIGIGNDWQSVSANQFEGIVTLVEVDQLGAPTI